MAAILLWWSVICHTEGSMSFAKPSHRGNCACQFDLGRQTIASRGLELLCMACSDSTVRFTKAATPLNSLSSVAIIAAFCRPWPDAFAKQVLVQRTHGDGLTLPGFLAAWTYTATTAPQRALAGLLYLGYEGDPAYLFNISRTHYQERKADSPQRSVCQACPTQTPPADSRTRADWAGCGGVPFPISFTLAY